MWNGKMTDTLYELMRQYAAAHHGVEPDGYDELNYDAMSYDSFVGYIKECLKTGKEMPSAVP